ncbi:MAG: PAS domain S-box protein [Nitrospirota bacterium]
MASKKPKGRRVVKDPHLKSKQGGNKRAAARAQANGARRTGVAKRRQLEAALLDAHTAVELAMEGISKLDDTGHYVFVNVQYASLLGYRPEELIGQSWEITVHPEDRTVVSDTFAQMLAIGRAEAEIRGVKKDGSLIYKHVVIVKPKGPAGKMLGHFCFVRDVTQRKREEAFLSAEKQALELVAKGAGLSEVLTSICRTIEAHTAPMLTSIMLVTEDGEHLRCVASPSLPEDYNRAVDGISIGPTVGSCGSAAYYGKPSIVVDIEGDLLWKDYVQLTRAHGLRACWSQPILSSTGTVLGTFAAYYKEPRTPNSAELAVVERAGHLAAMAIQHIKMSEALRESEARFQAFMTHSPAVSFIKDSAGRHLYINPTFERLFGLSLNEIRGKTLEGRVPNDVVARIRVNDEQVLSSGQPIEVEETVPTPDGMSQQWLVLKFPLMASSGERLLGGVAVDITARKQAEDALRESENRFRVIADTAPALIWMSGLDKGCTYFNTCWLHYTGRTMEQELGNGWAEGVHPKDFQRCLDIYSEAFDRRESFDMEYRLRKADGQYGWIHDSGVPRFLPDGTFAGYLGACIDITARKQAEEHSRQSEAFVTSVLEHLPHMVFVKEASDLRFVRFNRAGEALLGKVQSELLGKTDYDFFPKPEADFFTTKDREVLANGSLVDIPEETIQTAAGPRILHTKKLPIFGVDGTPRYLLGISEDITEQKRAEESLQRTQFAMDQAVDAVYWIDPQARILYTNNAASEMLGYTADEFQRMTVHDLNPDFPPEVWPGWWEETRERKVISLETVHLTKDGRRIPIDIRVSFLAYGGQEFHCAFVRDISEQRRLDGALRASQERFELAARATNDGIWDWNILTGEQYWSNRHLELFGLEPSALTPTYETWIALVHPDDADRVHQATCRHLETREPYDIEARVRMKDGRYRWFRDQGQAVWDSTGRPVRMVGSISDVTERREAEEALRSAHGALEQRVAERTAQLAQANRLLQDEIGERKRVEVRLRTTQYAVDHAADQIFVIGPDGFFLDVNESACRRLGYTKEELLRLSVTDLDPDFPQSVWSEFWVGFAQVGQLRLETRHRAKSGEIYPVEVVANYLCHDGQELDYAVVRDISERKQAEAALRDSELRYKLLTEATFDGIAIHDQGILLEVNAGLERMFGYGQGELLGRSVLDLVADESREQVIANMRDGVKGPYEAIGRRKDGTTFPGEVVVRPYHYKGKDVRLVAGRDITERKHLDAERRRYTEELKSQVAERTVQITELESQRAQTERLAALGRLAAGVAHEINNPIAGIKNAFELVKQAVDPAHAQYEFVGMIDREIARVSSIVQNMYQLYRRESGKVEMVDLQTMIEDIKALFAKRLQQRQLWLAVELEPHFGRLDVPRSDLLQVLLNLLNNAIDCSYEGGTITMTVREEAEVIRIAVADQGAGISPEVLPHIFDPFFTTKSEGEQKGMGLGLSISQSLVASMGGRIDVQTQRGQGSTFSVLLPRRKIVAHVPDQISIIKEVVTHGC